MPQSFAEHLKSFPLSPNLGQSLERAHGFAREQSHRLVTLEHLLLALTEDPEAIIIMQAANVDIARLTTDVSTHLGRLMEDMRSDGLTEPRPDPELLRVLQAAATAALQSRRRQIDGAIVLAAVVGDGKSPAAGMLKALGMTFEEAIRALQRANTKARLKPQTKPAAPAAAASQPSVQPSTPTPMPKPAAAPAATLAPSQANGAHKAEPAEPITTQQTAEEILAAARERIRQRSAAAKAERAAVAAATAPPAAPAPAPAAEPAPEPEPATDPATEAKTLAGAIEAAMAATPPASTEAATAPAATAPAEPAAEPSRAPPERAPNRAPIPGLPPIMRRMGGPPLPRPIQANEGPPRPPLPLRPGQRPAGKFPPTRAPWPEPDAGPGSRLPMPNGKLGGAHHPPIETYGPGAPWPVVPPPAQRAGPPERGPLVENVPRVMRVGVPVEVEVRIARDKIESLILTLSGRGAQSRPDTFVTRSVSVRLRAPHGGFWIEAATPETQWAETASTVQHDDHAVWRWLVLPHRRGRGRLMLMVSTRTVGQDGIASESTPPERMIEIRVKSNKLRGLGSLLLWLIVLSAGAAAGYLGQDIWEPALVSIKRLIGG